MGRSSNSNSNPQSSGMNSTDQTARLTYGLFLSGVVIDRTRRRVPRDNPTTEIVTYTIGDDTERKYYVDDYAPDHYYNLGAHVTFPVYVKPYQKKNSEISYSLCIQKNSSPKGEHF